MIVFTNNVSSQVFTYDFSTGYDGWMGDFADYPVTDSVFYQLEFTRTALPNPLNTSNYALKITGNNHSDDLFMFIKRKISGLLPNTTYQLQIEIEFASNAPTNAIGVGGAPGEGVTMKAGASIVEPLKINSSGFYIMNIDKSNQSQPGVDMDTIGHVGVSDTTTKFTLIDRSNTNHLFSITTDSNGEAWVCIGTDSGFEATTTLYYNLITLTFSTVTALEEIANSFKLNIYPNPASNLITIQKNKNLIDLNYVIIDPLGNHVLTGQLKNEITPIDISQFTTGVYLFTVGKQMKQTFKVIKQ
jgi:hypothetical protein